MKSGFFLKRCCLLWGMGQFWKKGDRQKGEGVVPPSELCLLIIIYAYGLQKSVPHIIQTCDHPLDVPFNTLQLS